MKRVDTDNQERGYCCKKRMFPLPAELTTDAARPVTTTTTMRVLNLLPFVFLSTVLASFIPDAQVVLGDTLSPIRDAVSGLPSPLRSGMKEAGAKIHKWVDGEKTFVQEHGLMCESLNGQTRRVG